MSEFQHHHVLVLIETAQRDGRTESELVQLVETQIGRPSELECGDERRLIRRSAGAAGCPTLRERAEPQS